MPDLFDEVSAPAAGDIFDTVEPQPVSDVLARIPAGIAKASADALVGISRATSAIEPYLPIVGNLERLVGQGDYREKQQKAQEEMAQLGESAAAAYGVKEEYNKTFPSQIASAVGSIVPAVASGPLAPVTVAGMMGEQQRQEAEAAGATESQKNIAFIGGASVGAISEALLGIPQLLRSAKAAGIGAATFKEVVKEAAKQAVKSAGREGAQEGLEQVAQNIVASKIAGYDPKRKVFEGVPQAAAIGAIVGAPVGAAVQTAESLDQVRAQSAVVTADVNKTISEVATAEPPPVPPSAEPTQWTKLSDIPPSAETQPGGAVPSTTAEVGVPPAESKGGEQPNAAIETRVQPEGDQFQYQGTNALGEISSEAGNRNRDVGSGEIPQEAQVSEQIQPSGVTEGMSAIPEAIRKATKIKWVKPDPEESFYQSHDGRFEIAPLYLGRVRPQAWAITDKTTGQKKTTHHGLKAAQDIAEEWKNPKPKQQPPELTEDYFRKAHAQAIAQGSTNFAQTIIEKAAEKGFDITKPKAPNAGAVGEIRPSVTTEPTTARAGTEPIPPQPSTPSEGGGGVGPASGEATANLSAAQLNERIDTLLAKHQAETDPAVQSKIFAEAKALMSQLKTAEEQSMGPGAAAATETLAQYAERKFGIRFEEDQNIAPELKKAAGNRFYEVLPNKVTAQEASDIIDRLGDDAAERLVRDEKTDTSFATRSTVGQILIKKLNQQYNQLKETNPQEASRVLNRAADLAEWQMDYGTRLGQGVQSFAMWYRLSSEGKLITIKKAVRKARERHQQQNDKDVNEVLDVLNSDRTVDEKQQDIDRLSKTNGTAKKIRKKVKELAAEPQTPESFYDKTSKELGLPELTADQETKLRELGAAVDDAAEGIPKWNAAKEYLKYADGIKGFSVTDSLLFYFYGNILSGFGTQAVNTVDTLLNVIHEVNTLALSDRKAAATIYEGLVRGLDTGRADAVLAFMKGRRISSGQIGEAHGFGESVFGEKGGVPLNIKGPVSLALKTALETKPAKVFRLWKYIGRAMSASDAVMFRGAQEARAGLLAYRIATEEGLTTSQRTKRVNEILGWDRIDEYMAKAKAEGFTGSEQAARATELMIQGRPEGLNTDASTFAASATYNDKPKGALGFASRMASSIAEKYPAFRLIVPFTNIVANVFNRRLDNLPGVAIYRAKRGYYETPEEAKNAIIRMHVSMGLLTAVAGLAGAGAIEITGSGPDDPERKKQLRETGWRPYSLKIGDKYWTYANTPISLGLGIIGNMLDWQKYKPTTKKEDDRFSESAIYAVSSIFSYLLSQNFISGLSSFFNIISGSEGERKFALKRFLGSNAAAAVPLSGALKDIDSAFDDRLRVNKHLDEAILAQIPFARFAGKPALNAFGEAITTGKIRPLTRFVNQERTDPAWKLIADKSLRVPVPDPYFKTDDENYEYQKESGIRTKEWVLDNAERLRAMATPDAQELMNESTQRIRKGIRGRMLMKSIQ